jgi:hypothetical protein
MAKTSKNMKGRGSRLKGSGKRHEASRLKWLTEFLTTDVSRLSRWEFRKLHFQVLDFLYGNVEDRKDLRDVATDTDLNRRALIQIQGVCYSSLGDILDQSHRSLGDRAVRTNHLGEVLYDYRVKLDNVSLVPRRRTHPYHVPANLSGHYQYTPLKAGRQADEDYLQRYFLGKPNASDYAYFSRHYDPDIESTVLLSLIPLLENFSLNSIGRCTKCKAYFKKTKRKKSDLCRPCHTKKKIYDWRAKPVNHEAYNIYQRNLAKGLKDETPTQIRDRRRKEKESANKSEGTS